MTSRRLSRLRALLRSTVCVLAVVGCALGATGCDPSTSSDAQSGAPSIESGPADLVDSSVSDSEGWTTGLALSSDTPWFIATASGPVAILRVRSEEYSGPNDKTVLAALDPQDGSLRWSLTITPAIESLESSPLRNPSIPQRVAMDNIELVGSPGPVVTSPNGQYISLQLNSNESSTIAGTRAGILVLDAATGETVRTLETTGLILSQALTDSDLFVQTAQDYVPAGSGTLAVAGVGAGWAYNRYLAEHTQIEDTLAYEAAQQSKNNPSGAADPTELTGVSITDSGLTAQEGSITLKSYTEGSGNNAVVSFTAEVKLNNATLLRSAFANNKFGQNIIDTPSNIAAQHNGIWAINGDYYGFRDTGIVIRNGVTYRDSPAREGLAFYRDGSVKLYDETSTNAQALIDSGVLNTLSFGPALVKNSEVMSGIDQVEVDTNFGNHSIQGNQPRTGVGVLGNNHLLFMVVDGRSDGYSRGVTMPEFAQMFKEHGCETAYNLDGGGSSVMVFNGKLVNKPLGGSKERGTSDILYIAGSAA